MSGTENKAVIFDLDGTLMDTVGDIADVCNDVLSEHGFPVHETAAYKEFLGGGALQLMRRALFPIGDEDTVHLLTEQFQRNYERCSMTKTGPFPGIREMLRDLRGRGIVTAVLSNKPHVPTVDIVQAHFPGLMDIVLGQREEVPLKPDPAALLELLSALHTHRSNCIYVGDSDVDAWTALQAHVLFIGVSWGFRTKKQIDVDGKRLIVDEVAELNRKIVDIFALGGYTG